MKDEAGADPPDVAPARTLRGEARVEQLLDAGAAAVRQRPASAVLPSRAEVLRAAEEEDGAAVSTGSFRHGFGSQEAFQRRLVHERLLDGHPVVPETIELLADTVDRLRRGERVNVADAAARAARLNLERNLDETELEHARLLCFVAALSPGGEEAAAALRRDFQDFTADFATTYEHILEAWGVELREPFDPHGLAVLLAALADGLTIRHLVDPDAIDVELFQHAVVGLILLVVNRPGDDRNFTRLIEEVFPRPADPPD